MHPDLREVIGEVWQMAVIGNLTLAMHAAIAYADAGNMEAARRELTCARRAVDKLKKGIREAGAMCQENSPHSGQDQGDRNAQRMSREGPQP